MAAPAHLCWHNNCHNIKYCQKITTIIQRMIWQHFYDNAIDTSFISNLAIFCIFDTLVEDRERRFDLFTLRSITARPPPPIKGKHGWVEWRKLWEGPFSNFKKCLNVSTAGLSQNSKCSSGAAFIRYGFLPGNLIGISNKYATIFFPGSASQAKNRRRT